MKVRKVSEGNSMVDEDKNEIEIEITPIESFAEFDMLMMLSILEKNRADGIEWAWLTNKLKRLVDGTAPHEVFPRIGREVQKNQTTDRDIRLVKMYVELRAKKLKKASIVEKLANSQCVSESVIETAWKKWGKFFPES